MTERCMYCGKKMQQVDIDGVTVWQCPKCLYIKPVQEPADQTSTESE